MASPCGEESLRGNDNWHYCLICKRQDDECKPIIIEGKLYWLCDNWWNIVSCYKTFKSLIGENHTLHCIQYMIAVNRKNCVCKPKGE
jgi:hypothetical protein